MRAPVDGARLDEVGEMRADLLENTLFSQKSKRFFVFFFLCLVCRPRPPRCRGGVPGTPEGPKAHNRGDGFHVLRVRGCAARGPLPRGSTLGTTQNKTFD